MTIDWSQMPDETIRLSSSGKKRIEKLINASPNELMFRKAELENWEDTVRAQNRFWVLTLLVLFVGSATAFFATSHQIFALLLVLTAAFATAKNAIFSKRHPSYAHQRDAELAAVNELRKDRGQ